HFAISLYNEGSKAALLVVAPHAVTHIKHRERYTSQLQLLAPHMVRAMDIGRRVSGGRMAERALGSSFEALGVAALLLGPSHRILLANDKAEALLRDRRLVRSDRFRCLRAAEPSQDAALALAIGAAMAAYPSPVTLRPVRLTSTAPG